MQVLEANTTSRAYGVSGDGNLVVGEATLPSRAFVWTPSAGMQFLTALDGSISGSARAVNFDGSIIVGTSRTAATGPAGTMWINGVPQQLFGATPNITDFTPRGVNDDGSVIAGLVGIGAFAYAGVWTPSTGAMLLSDFLDANGVTLPAGSEFTSCNALSADGLTFGGEIFIDGHRQGYVATVPGPTGSALLGVLVALKSMRRRPVED